MPSPRSRFETACRVGAFAILGWLLGNSLIPDTSRRVERASAEEVGHELAAWSRARSGEAMHVSIDATPPAWVVDWLGALRRSGHSVSWSGSPPALAISASGVPDPVGGVRVDVGAPSGASVAIADASGTIDSLRIAGFGATVVTPIAADRLQARVGAQSAAAQVPDSSRLRAVLVVSAAGWEGKYVASALEERGWPVVARFAVAPGVDVRQGAAEPLDTSRYSAVVAIDSTIDRLAPDVIRFVRQGGGLILAGRAGASRDLASLAPGVPGVRTRNAVRAADTLRLGTTGFYPVASLKPDAVTVERRGDRVAVAARRVGAGRVMQIGYDDSWRWRMAGGASSEVAHREWWSRVVGSVAYVPASDGRALANVESAPLAHLVDQLGPSRPSPSPQRPALSQLFLLILMMILLLTEWASRRWRGLR
jgi:hypothetical protein